MADGCEERFDWEFLRWTWNYPRDSKPKVENMLKRFETEKAVIRLRSRKAVNTFDL